MSIFSWLFKRRRERAELRLRLEKLLEDHQKQVVEAQRLKKQVEDNLKQAQTLHSRFQQKKELT